MLTPRPWQIEGAKFLASRKYAGLFDDPRVGKCGASLLACNAVGAETVNVITTRSGVPVWQRAFDQWNLRADRRCIASWGGDIRALARLESDVLIVDECHKACNPGSERSRAVYGELGPDGRWSRETSAMAQAKRVWALSGTMPPHDNSNWWPILRALAPGVLETAPLVRAWPSFRDRYCKTALKKIPHGPPIPVVIGGQNSDELRERIKSFFLRRTQAEVGISEPTFDLLPLKISTAALNNVEHDIKRDAVLAAAENGDTKKLELMLAEIMRLTGEIKADSLWGPVSDELDGGAEKIVLAYWHRRVGDMLEAMFTGPYGVLRLDGSTPPSERARLEGLWRRGRQRVFLAQMEAGGEAIDLSAAASMIIVEPVFRPATMRQMALRITNINERRTPVVRVAVLAGSIDEAVQERLMALWAPIKEVLRA